MLEAPEARLTDTPKNGYYVILSCGHLTGKKI